MGLYNQGETETEDRKKFEFEEGNDVVGFWGNYVDSKITQIGFILKDNACVAENGVETEFVSNSDGSGSQNGNGNGTGNGGDGTGTDVSFSSKDNPTGKTVTFASKPGSEVSEGADDDDSDVVLTVVIILIVVVILAILIILIVHFWTKRNANKVTVLNSDSRSQPHTANNSAIP